MKKIKLGQSIVLACTFMAFNSVAHADILAGGAIYGGPTQDLASCYIYNAGSGAVQITGKKIQKEPNIVQVAAHDTCGATLAAGSSCAIAVTSGLVSNAAYMCRIVVSPSGADVRGSFELRDSTGNILNNVELR